MSGIVHAIDADGRFPFEHHPDDRLIIGDGLFDAFGEADFFDLEIVGGAEPRDGREEAGDVAARLLRLGRAGEVDAFECLIDVQRARLAVFQPVEVIDPKRRVAGRLDRKSTRLNSSHI